MSSSLVLKVANVTSTITFAKTDAEVATILGYFIADYASPMPDGLTQAQQNQWRLDQAAARIVQMIRHEAQRVHLRDLLAAQQSASDQAANDTQI